MSELVFYCTNCQKTFTGKDYRASDRPECPKCGEATRSTGITREQWLQMSKDEREALLRGLERKEEHAQQKEEYAASIGVTVPQNQEDVKKSFMDDLYADIGKKIKGWAKWIFVIEAIASVVGAIGMLFAAEDGGMIITALLALILGPVLAWVSSWILYAFGELVDKTVQNEQNTRDILNLMLEEKLDQ